MTGLLLLAGCASPADTAASALSVRVRDNPGLVLEKRVLVGGAAPGRVSLRCELDSDPREVHSISDTVSGAEAGSEHALRIEGLLADSRYRCEVDSGGASAAFSFDTGSLPEGLPSWSLAGSTTGYTLFNDFRSCAGPVAGYAVIVDPLGRVRWYMALDRPGWGDVDASYLGDGRLLLGGGDAVYTGDPGHGTIVEVDLSQEPSYERDSSVAGSGGPHHDVERLPDGREMALHWRTETLGGRSWLGCGVEVYDPASGEVSWAWDTLDGVEQGVLPVPGALQPDPFHCNAASWSDDGAVYLGLYTPSWILRIGRESRQVDWVLGPGGDFALVGPDGAALDEDGWFYNQHDPEFEGDRVLVYDNGLARPGGPSSRVLELELDEDAMAATLLWSWTEPGWVEPVVGDADRLEGGRVLVTMGHCACCGMGGADRSSSLVEIDPASGEVLWRLDWDDPSHAPYRAERIDGCDIFANLRYCR